jgi:Ser/Thr protein kinase RdoA (MazF antagonist)
MYGAAVPGVFPRVVAFHPAAHAMVLADVFPDGRNYHQHLDERAATIREMALLGGALRRVHDATRGVREPVRPGGDERFRDHTFDFCLRARGHPVLDGACEEMLSRPGQQLVLGDVAPKNLSLAGGQVAMCDLDNVHVGWALYDVAYVFAHVLIHHLTRPRRLPALARALLGGYFGAPGAAPEDEPLLAVVAAGVVLYRLDSTVVPYPLAVPAAVAAEYRRRVRALLDAGPFGVGDLVRGADPQALGSV